MPPPPDNGIVDGVVVNPKHYFLSLVWNRDPRDYPAVFLSIKQQLWNVGIGFQTRSDGTPTSRVYLPTSICPNASPPPNEPIAVKLGVRQDERCWDQQGRFADTVENDSAGHPIAWTWAERGPGTYQPLTSTQPVPVPNPPPTDPPPPTGDLAAKVDALERKLARLEAASADHGDAIMENVRERSLIRGRLETLEQRPSGGSFDPSLYQVKTAINLGFRTVTYTGLIERKA